MGLKSFAIVLLKHWISMLRGRQNMLEVIKCPSRQKDLSKNIMKRSRLRNKYLKNK